MWDRTRVVLGGMVGVEERDERKLIAYNREEEE